jgi:hypothetical protein
MPTGNSYPAPNLPLNGTEQFTLFQQQGAIVQTCTVTISALTASISAGAFASPPPIGSITPNSGAFTLLSVTGFESFSLNNAVVAAGNSQATATPIVTSWAVVAEANTGTGVVLPTVTPGTPVRIFYTATGGNTLSVYPPPGQQIGTLVANAPSGMFVNMANDFCFVGNGTWLIK